MTESYDLFVIGAGSGGVRAARMAASKGARVAVAEDRDLGGTCVNVGCVPKKLFVYASHFNEEFHHSKGFGFEFDSSTAPIGFNWSTLRDNKNTEIKRLNGIYEQLLTNAQVEIINGKATIKDAHTVTVNGVDYHAHTLLVATGGWPFVPDFPGKEHVITSNEVFYLDQLPKTALVVGGGYIAVEFAGIFAGLGVETTQLYRGPLFLKGFDHDIRAFIKTEMEKKGVHLNFNSDIESVRKDEQGKLHATLQDGSTIITDLILYATGRKPKTQGLGLEQAGVALKENGAIKVDDYFQTNVPSIYALGDVIDRVQLTPVAISEAMAFVRTVFDHTPTQMDYSNIPTAVFCQPNIGTVGLTEEQAKIKFNNITLYCSTFRAMKHTLSGSDEKTFMKLIVDADTDKIIGAHMVGSDAGEMIQGIGIAIKAGATKAIFDATVGIHPTSAEEWVTLREPTASTLG